MFKRILAKFTHKKSLCVAQYILDRFMSEYNHSISPMKLNKLVYIAHGYMLGKHSKPLLDENVMAWQYGPIVKSVYHSTKHYRSSHIDKVPGGCLKYEFCIQEKEVMNQIVKTYAEVTAITLSAATHQEGTPWSETWYLNKRASVISNDLIEHFYKKILSQKSHSSI